MYGESVFTSTLIMPSGPWCLKEHLERIVKSLGYVFSYTLSDSDIESIKIFIDRERAKAVDANYLRLTFFKEVNNQNDDLIFDLTLEHRPRAFNAQSLKTLVNKYSSGFPNFVKMGNYAYSFYHKSLVQKMGFDDVLFCDESGNILELSTSNIFFVDNNKLFLPKENERILDGVCKNKILKIANDLGLEVNQKDINLKDIANFQFSFSSNSFVGMRAIKKIDDVHFMEKNDLFEKIKERLYC